MVKGLVAQIASHGIFNRGLKLKSVHHNYQNIEKKKLRHGLWLIRKHLPSRFKRRMTWIGEHMFGVNMSNCEPSSQPSRYINVSNCKALVF